ncbi:hypothetical protein C0995_001350 [Termitomyces sp. Mi166|nr:hypothetical protein C0995_001350 [Termitomyces sp. Mi166\
MFQGKPHTFTSDQAQVAFATSYLQGIALDHDTTILCFNPGHPLFTNWQAFINRFSSKFRVSDMVTKAERKLMSLRMSTDKHFTMFVVQFEKEAYGTGWNYNVLRFQLSEALPKHIHNVLQLALKQPTYEGFKNLVTQIDQCHWEDPSALLTMHWDVPQSLGTQPQPLFLCPPDPPNVTSTAPPLLASAHPVHAQGSN